MAPFLNELRRYTEQRRTGRTPGGTPLGSPADPQAARRAQLEDAAVVARKQDADRLASARRLLEWLEIERNAPEGALASDDHWLHQARTLIFEADRTIGTRRNG